MAGVIFENQAGIITDQWDDVASTYTQRDDTGTLIRGPIAYSALTATDPAYPIAQGQAQRLAGQTAVMNYQAILTAAQNQRTNNTAYLGLSSPTNAQVIAQVAALTRQNNALMRLAVNDLTGTS